MTTAFNAELAPSVRNNRKRLSPQAYLVTKSILTKIQLGICAICHEPGIEEIDHINGDPSDNHADNLRGVHKSCNIRQRNLQRTRPANSVGERVSKEESAEIEINRDAEPRYRKWLWERTNKQSPLYTGEAIYGGAEFVGISPVTARRYLGKATSPQGSYFVETVKAQNRTLKMVVPK
jgi:hypothetical protein